MANQNPGIDDAAPVKMDRLDLSIIGALQANGRVPLTELADRLHVSHGTVRNRLERLVARGVLIVTAHVEPTLVGFPERVFIGIKADLHYFKHVEDSLTRLPEVTFVAAMTGRFDILVGAAFSSREHLREFLTTKIARIQGIRNTETLHVLGYAKRIWQWGIPDRDSNRGPGVKTRRRKAQVS